MSDIAHARNACVPPVQLALHPWGLRGKRTPRRGTLYYKYDDVNASFSALHRAKNLGNPFLGSPEKPVFTSAVADRNTHAQKLTRVTNIKSPPARVLSDT